VNGKPLIFKLDGISFAERQGMLEIKRPFVNFSYIPIGYMDYIVCPLELYNVGGIKIKYKINKNQIDEFNKNSDNFEIFKIEQIEGNIGTNDLKYIPIFFRPLTSKEYILNLDIIYADESLDSQKDREEGIERVGKIPVVIKGIGYHPMKFTPPKIRSPFASMPKERLCNTFGGEVIQKCGLSIEEIDFGECEEGVPKNQTFIIYNYSQTNSLNFEFNVPGFCLKDVIEIKPKKDKLEPNSHKIIKMILTPKGYLSNYDGEIEAKITWNNTKDEIEQKINKEILHIRIRKLALLKNLQGKVEKTINTNQNFIETLLTDLTREIMGEDEFQENLVKLIDEQPLGLYDWTTNVEYPDQDEVREIINNRYIAESRAGLFNEAGSNLNSNKKIPKIPSHHSDSRYTKTGGKYENDGVSSINDKGLGDMFWEADRLV
jgi:hypothetical protein